MELRLVTEGMPRVRVTGERVIREECELFSNRLVLRAEELAEDDPWKAQMVVLGAQLAALAAVLGQSLAG